MKQLLMSILYGILLRSVQTQSQPKWVADFGSGFVKETDHAHNATHTTSQSTSAKFLGAGASVDPKHPGNTNKPDVQNLLANPNELPPPPAPTRRDQSPFETVDPRPPPPTTRRDQTPVESIDSRPPPVSATDAVRERKLQQLKFIMGNDVPRAKLEALLDVFGSDSASSQSQSQPTRPPPPPRNPHVLAPRERQERPSSNGWPSTPPPPRETRAQSRRQEPRVDPFMSSDTIPSVIPPPPGSANRGQRPSRGFNREFSSATESPPNFDGPPQGRVDMDARRQEMIERRLQQEQAKNSQESNLQMMRTLRALTRQRARTPAAEAPEQPEPGSMNPLLMALFSGMGGGGEAGSTGLGAGLGGGLGGLLGGGGDLASLMAMQRGGSAGGAGGAGGMSSLLGSMGGGMGGLASLLGLGMGGLGGTGATDPTDSFIDQVHDHPVKPTTLPVQAITTKVSNPMDVVKTGQISQTRLDKTTVAPKPMLTNVADHRHPNQRVHSVQTHIDPVTFLDVNNQIHDHPVPHSNSLGPDVRTNLIDQPSNELLPTLLDSTINKSNKKNLTLQELFSTTMPSSVLVGVRRNGIRIPARQNLTGENTIMTPELMPTKEMNVSGSQYSGLFDMIPKTPNAGFGVHSRSRSQSSFGSVHNTLKTTVPPPAPLNAAMDIHGQVHDHPIGLELTSHAAGHGQQSGNGKLSGRDNQSSGNTNTNNPSSALGVPSDLAALLQMQLGARGSGVSSNAVGMGGLPSASQMMSMTGTGVGSSGAGGFGNMGAVTTSLEMMSLVPGLTLDQMSDLLGSYRGPIPREILVQAQALSRAGQSGDQIADVLGDVMQQWVRQQGLAAHAGFSAGSTGVV